MNLLNRIFNTKKVDCPRCLGKGNVDWDDIKRLKKELRWRPGSCAYCNGKGKVNSNMESKVDIDNTYLTTDLDNEERKLILNNDTKALERANHLDIQIDDFIKQVEYLHFNGNMDSKKITEFYLLPKIEIGASEPEKEELEDYIKRIIKHNEEN